ncbi:MAG: acyl-CoA dehydrogenase [Bacillota bacterium]
MRFDLTEDQKEIKKAIAELTDKYIAPGADELDRESRYPEENLKLLAQQGYMGMTFPETLGGIGADFVAYTICIEEISRGCASTGVIFEVHQSLAGWPILYYGTEEQKQKFIPKMATGEMLGAFALTEPGAGSDAASIRTQAVKDGDHYVLNGRKCFISGSGKAGLYVVIAYTNKEAGSRGMSAFLVEAGTPGLGYGKPEDKMGIRASTTADLILEDVRVPARNLLGKEGDGFKIALSTLDGGRIGIAAQAVGIARAAYEKARDYALKREQFGKPIASFQAIQWMLADMATDIEAAQLLTYRAAYLKQTGARFSKEAAMAKLFASRMAVHHTSQALQIHGGYGYMREYQVERHMRDAKITEIYEGTSEVMRLVISAQILKEAGAGR